MFRLHTFLRKKQKQKAKQTNSKGFGPERLLAKRTVSKWWIHCCTALAQLDSLAESARPNRRNCAALKGAEEWSGFRSATSATTLHYTFCSSFLILRCCSSALPHRHTRIICSFQPSQIGSTCVAPHRRTVKIAPTTGSGTNPFSLSLLSHLLSVGFLVVRRPHCLASAQTPTHPHLQLLRHIP